MKQVSLSILIAVALLLAACGENKKNVDQGKLAAKAAKHYYEQLLKGDYEAFLNNENRTNNLPDNYRKQLLLNLKQFVAQQDSVHHGIDSITLGASHFSAKDNTASVFLLFYYGDKTTEQVVVPMVKERGKWILR
jgi:putative lipoprotein